MLAAGIGTATAPGGIPRYETIRSWSTSTGGERWSLHLSEGVLDIQFHPSGYLLAAALEDRTIRLIDAITGAEFARLKGHTGTINGLRFTPDGARLVSVGADGTVRIWRIKLAAEKVVVDGGQDARGPRFAKVSLDGKSLLALSGATLKLWDLNTHKLLIERYYDRTLQPRATGFMPGNDRVYVYVSRLGPVRADIRVLDVRTGRDLMMFSGPEGGFLDFKLVPKYGRAAILERVRSASDLQIWDTSVGKVIRRFSLTSGNEMEFSPTGGQAAVLSSRIGSVLGDDENPLALYDANTGRLLRRFEAPAQTASPLVFSPDGNRLAAVTNARGITIWDTQTGRKLFSLPDQSSSVAAMAFSPDGTRLASVSSDGEVLLWDSHLGRQMIPLRTSGGPYPAREVEVKGPPSKGAASFTISFSPDGHHVRLDTVTHGPNGLTVRIASWDGTPARR
jgi:WD40 repeat protein